MRIPRPRVAVLLAVAVGLTLLGPAPAAAQVSPDRSRVIEPFTGMVTNPCGEDVRITGEVLIHFVGIADAHGGLHGTLLTRLQQVAAVGVESGTAYQVVQLEHAGGTADGRDLALLASTEISSFLLVSQGADTNLVGHGTIHYQTDPTGTVRADVSFSQRECLG